MSMLTGNVHYRQGWFGKMILIVEYKYPGVFPGDWNRRWRDATYKDVADLIAMKESK